MVLIRQKSLISFFRFFFFNYIMLLWFFQFFSLIFIEVELILASNIHPNPGQFDNRLKFCHWNLNGVCARDKIKIPLLEAYNSIFHYDLMVLTETYLNKTVKNEDIIIDGFSTEIFRGDHPSGDKQGGVCVYFKENLPVKRRKDLEILQETVICEISLGRKKVFFVALYHFPDQSNKDFEQFYHKLQDNLDQIKELKPHCTILTGDFNCRTEQFWPGDTDSPKGIALDELIESNNMTQLIDQLTNLESRGISCVDLIITDQPNLFIDYGIHSSLDNCCHHQIIHGKVNISIRSPSPFNRKIWDYAKAIKDETQECLNNIDWHYKLNNLSATNRVSEFTSTIRGVMSRFIPNKIITCNDKDPPWITPEIKTAIKRKHHVYNKYVRQGCRPDEWDNVRLIRNDT